MKIEVTQEDIERGVPLNSCFCPIAFASSRAFHCQHSLVSQDYFRVLGVGKNGRIMLPQPAIDFIAAFDAGKPVEPFSFEVEV